MWGGRNVQHILLRSVTVQFCAQKKNKSPWSLKLALRPPLILEPWPKNPGSTPPQNTHTHTQGKSAAGGGDTCSFYVAAAAALIGWSTSVAEVLNCSKQSSLVVFLVFSVSGNCKIPVSLWTMDAEVCWCRICGEYSKSSLNWRDVVLSPESPITAQFRDPNPDIPPLPLMFHPSHWCSPQFPTDGRSPFRCVL